MPGTKREGFSFILLFVSFVLGAMVGRTSAERLAGLSAEFSFRRCIWKGTAYFVNWSKPCQLRVFGGWAV